MNRYIRQILVAFFVSTTPAFCDSLRNVGFDVEFPSYSTITGIAENAVITLGPTYGGVNTNAVIDIVHDMDIGIKTNNVQDIVRNMDIGISTQDVQNIVAGMDIIDEERLGEVVGVAVTNAFGNNIAEEVDSYISRHGVSSVVTNLFNNTKGSFVQNVNGSAYGLMNAEAYFVVTNSEFLTLHLRCLEGPSSPSAWSAGWIEIRFKTTTLIDMLDKTYNRVYDDDLVGVGVADITLKNVNLVGDTRSITYRDVPFNVFEKYSGSSTYNAKVKQINGTNLQAARSIEQVNNKAGHVVWFNGRFSFPGYSSATSLYLLYNFSAALATANAVHNSAESTLIKPASEVYDFFYVVIRDTEASSWSSIATANNETAAYSFSYDDMYFSKAGESVTNGLAYGPLSPVITEWHLNNVSNEWRDIVRNAVDAERSFFTSNLVLSESLVNTASNIVVMSVEDLSTAVTDISNRIEVVKTNLLDTMNVWDSTVSNKLYDSGVYLYDTLDAWSNAAARVQADTDAMERIIDNVVTSRITTISNILIGVEAGVNTATGILHDAEAYYVDATNALYVTSDRLETTISNSVVNMETTVTNTLVDYMSAVNDSIFVISNIETVAIREGGVRLGFPITYAPTSSVIRLHGEGNYNQDALEPQVVYIDFTKSALVSLTNFLSGNTETLNGRKYGGGWVNYVSGKNWISETRYENLPEQAGLEHQRVVGLQYYNTLIGGIQGGGSDPLMPNANSAYFYYLNSRNLYYETNLSVRAQTLSDSWASAYGGLDLIRTARTFPVYRVSSVSGDVLGASDVRLVAIPQVGYSGSSAAVYSSFAGNKLTTLQRRNNEGIMTPCTGYGLDSSNAIKSVSIKISPGYNEQYTEDIYLPLLVDMNLDTEEDPRYPEVYCEHPRLGLLLKYTRNGTNAVAGGYVAGFDTLIDYLDGKADSEELYNDFISNIKWFVAYSGLVKKYIGNDVTVDFANVLSESDALRCVSYSFTNFYGKYDGFQQTSRAYTEQNSGIFLYDNRSLDLNGNSLAMSLQPLGEQITGYRRTVTSVDNLEGVIDNRIRDVLGTSTNTITLVYTNTIETVYTNDFSEYMAVSAVYNAIHGSGLETLVADANYNMARVVAASQAMYSNVVDHTVQFNLNIDNTLSSGGYLTSNQIEALVFYIVTNSLQLGGH